MKAIKSQEDQETEDLVKEAFNFTKQNTML